MEVKKEMRLSILKLFTRGARKLVAESGFMTIQGISGSIAVSYTHLTLPTTPYV